MSDKQITLTLPVQAVETLLVALGKMPFEQVADLFSHIRQQAVSQINAAPTDERVEPIAVGGTD